MASVLLIAAVPVFFLSIGVEYLLARRQNRSVYDFRDTVTNLLIGMGSEITGVVTGLIKIGAYTFAFSHLRLVQIENEVVLWLLALIGVDFCYYWYHRLGHEVNALWSFHVVHHQSEEYNYAVALRQSWFGGLAGWLFYLPLAVLGVPPELFATSLVLNLLYQFFIHTRLAGRLGVLEFVLNTPSHHRVHHGTNFKYLDKNYGGVLILWDRLFGSFAQEEEEPAYGIVKPWTSASAVGANLQPVKELVRGFFATNGVINKLKFLLMPPGWEPSDQSRDELMQRTFQVAAQRTSPGRMYFSSSKKIVVTLLVCAAAATLAVMLGSAVADGATVLAALAALTLIYLLSCLLETAAPAPVSAAGSVSEEAEGPGEWLRPGFRPRR